MSEFDSYLKVAVELAREAGEIMINAVKQEKKVEIKLSNVDLVTETDKKVEEFLISSFRKHYPDHCFIGEESTGCTFTDAPTWIIDPIDGTMNFVHNFPHFCVSIGLTINKQVVLGVIYNPSLNRMYTGVKGGGAYCNGEKLHTSKIQDVSQALVLSEFGGLRTEENMKQIFENMKCMVSKAHGIRQLGSAALNMCAVASGDADAYYEYTIHCWDMAAGQIIIEEAGGIVRDPQSGPLDLMGRRVLCAATTQLADQISPLLVHLQYPRDQ